MRHGVLAALGGSTLAGKLKLEKRPSPQAVVAFCFVACSLLLLKYYARPPASTAVTQTAAWPSTSSCTVETTYVSSELEKAWMENVDEWQNSFCNLTLQTPQVQAWTQSWLKTLEQQRHLADQGIRGGVGYDPRIFSQFVTTKTCALPCTAAHSTSSSDHHRTVCAKETVTQHLMWIEPLAAGLRHPLALCGRGNVMNMDYLLLAPQDEVSALQQLHSSSSSSSSNARIGSSSSDTAVASCHQRACQNIYFDLGATTYDVEDTAGQGWFIRHYRRNGIEFDRLLLWEAKPTKASKVFAQLPPDLLARYQYYNIPATTNMLSPSHPVQVLQQVAQPGDFVVFKLDIDNPKAELAILQALLDSKDASGLVDEFFFEYHVNFEPMMEMWSLHSDQDAVDHTKQLSDAYRMFYQLRQRGWRAHSWV